MNSCEHSEVNERMRVLDDAFRGQLDQKELAFQQKFSQFIQERDRDLAAANRRVFSFHYLFSLFRIPSIASILYFSLSHLLSEDALSIIFFFMHFACTSTWNAQSLVI